MASKERLPEPKRVQSVVEWQYPRAHTYWDDCGKLVAAVENAFPGLTCQGLQPDGFHFVGLSKGITGAVFYWDKASITQAGRGDAGLAVAAGLFWPLVQQSLVITRVNRVGHRTWLCYERPSVVDGIRWLDDFRFVTLAPEGAGALGTPMAAGSVIRTKLEVGGRRLRLEANAGTATIDKKETHGVIIDIDIAIEPPEPTFEAAEFVGWNVGFIRNTIDPMFRRK